MLTSLGLYELSFQQDFLDDSRAFYEAEGLSKLQSSDIPAYLLHCEVVLLSPLRATMHLRHDKSKHYSCSQGTLMPGVEAYLAIMVAPL